MFVIDKKLKNNNLWQLLQKLQIKSLIYLEYTACVKIFINFVMFVIFI